MLLRMTIFVLLCSAAGGLSLSPPSVAQVFLSNQRVVNFSSPTSCDTFQVVVVGSDTLKALVTFTISSSSGKLLFRRRFRSDELLGFSPIAKPGRTVSAYAERSIVTQRVRDFFADTEFLRPAVQPTSESFRSPALPEAVWRELRSDSTSVGFHFLLGEENNQCIAFSNKLKKVVVYLTYD